MYDRAKSLFDVPSRRSDKDYSSAIAPECIFGVCLLYRDFLETHQDWPESWMPEVQRAMAHTHFALADTRQGRVGLHAIAKYLGQKGTPNTAFLDFLEISFRDQRAPNVNNDFVDAVNVVLEQYESPYMLTRYVCKTVFEAGQRGPGYRRVVIDAYPRAYLKQNTIVQKRAIEPALEIFSDPAYKVPAEDFRTALDRHRLGDYDGCVTACAAAVEGTIKVTAKKNAWRKVKGDGLGKLAQSFISRSSLSDSFHATFSPLAVYRIRGGDAHGHAEKDEPTEAIARYFVANSASLIVLVQSEAK